MIDEVSAEHVGGHGDNTGNASGAGTVNLRTFLLIMEYSSW
jgi:hypothetical protein